MSGTDPAPVRIPDGAKRRGRTGQKLDSTERSDDDDDDDVAEEEAVCVGELSVEVELIDSESEGHWVEFHLRNYPPSGYSMSGADMMLLLGVWIRLVSSSTEPNGFRDGC